MKKTNLIAGGIFLTIAISFMLFTAMPAASAACYDNSQIIVKLSSATNAHAELADQNNYNDLNVNRQICYNDLFGSVYAGANPQTCTGNNRIARLSSETNAHAQIPTLALDGSITAYSWDVCYGNLVCASRSACQSGEAEVISLSSETNAHLASDGSYSTKICCSSPALCANECSAGEFTCSGANAYQSCGNYDSDSCLEFGGAAESCGSRQLCDISDGICKATECTDTDNSRYNYDTAGIVSGIEAGREFYYIDDCVGSNILREYYCSSTLEPSADQYTCPTGQICSNGACTSQACAPQTCAGLGQSCGVINDGCGANLDCGSCSSGQSCSNGQCVAIDCDADESTCSSCGLPWNIGGETETTKCCGDDADQYANSLTGRNSGNYYDVAWNSNTNIDACCSNFSDCVDAAGNCVSVHGSSSGFNPGGDDNVAVCEWGPTGGDPRWWFDCDYNSVACDDCSLTWSKGGENITFGEYDTGKSSLECCGDDANEYFKRKTGVIPDIEGDDACCNSNTDCVYGWTCYQQDSIIAVNDSLGVKCSAGDWASYTGISNAKWKNFIGAEITNAETGDSVKLATEGYGLSGKDINFTIYKDGFWFFDALISSPDSSGTWTTWQASEAGTFYFKARIEETGQEVQSGSIVVSSTEDNTAPVAVLNSPANGARFEINTPISFAQSSYDIDDDISIAWNFDDGNTTTFTSCLTGGNCNTSHAYTSAGTKNVIITATDARGRTDTDFASIDIFQGGGSSGEPAVNVFSRISKPQPNDIIQGSGWVFFNASSSYAANCSSASCPINGAGNCYTVGSLECRNLNQNNLMLNWTFDDGTSRYGTWQSNYSYAVEFNKFFSSVGVHNAALRAGYP